MGQLDGTNRPGQLGKLYSATHKTVELEEGI